MCLAHTQSQRTIHIVIFIPNPTVHTHTVTHTVIFVSEHAFTHRHTVRPHTHPSILIQCNPVIEPQAGCETNKGCYNTCRVPHNADGTLESAVHLMLHPLAICSASLDEVYQKSIC